MVRLGLVRLGYTFVRGGGSLNMGLKRWKREELDSILHLWKSEFLLNKTPEKTL